MTTPSSSQTLAITQTLMQASMVTGGTRDNLGEPPLTPPPPPHQMSPPPSRHALSLPSRHTSPPPFHYVLTADIPLLQAQDCLTPRHELSQALRPADVPLSQVQECLTPSHELLWALRPQHQPYVHSAAPYLLGVPGGHKWERLLASYIIFESLSSARPVSPSVHRHHHYSLIILR